MASRLLAVPIRRVSGRVAETDANYARAWLAALPMADSAEAAREVYQALFRINRADIKAPARLELLSLYSPTISAIAAALQPQLSHSVPPLTPQKREPAELLRRLHIEMAHGYQRCLHDLRQTRVLLRRKRRSALCIERGLFHLSEVLFLSYLLYLPYPMGVWRELHELYSLSESMGIANAAVDGTDAGATAAASIAARYVQTLLLGVTNPYQLPQNAVQPMRALLGQWGQEASLSTPTPIKEATGCFYIDLSSDTAPIPLAKKSAESTAHARILRAGQLLVTVQCLAARTDEEIRLELHARGIDCPEDGGADLLRRLTRALGEAGRRRYARRQQSSHVLVCIGFDALHYVANGRRPFAVYVDACRVLETACRVLETTLPAGGDANAHSAGDQTDDKGGATNVRRIGRWRLRDAAPQGMSLAHHGDAVPVRVGDLIGVQQAGDSSRWRPAVIRWIKSPETNSVEVGVEFLAAAVVPVAARSKDASVRPALRLPDAGTLDGPAALVLESGSAQVGDEFELMEETADTRRVKLLRLLERTGAFEQFVYEVRRG